MACGLAARGARAAVGFTGIIQISAAEKSRVVSEQGGSFSNRTARGRTAVGAAPGIVTVQGILARPYHSESNAILARR